MWEAGGGEGDLVGLDVMTCKNIRTINVNRENKMEGVTCEDGDMMECIVLGYALP
jgi:hypothetical protein